MSEIPGDTIQCCVTSPPYWGLRKYDGEQDAIWGGDSECVHEWATTAPRRTRNSSDIKNLNSKEATNGGNLGIELPPTNTCNLCGAWKGAYGLEPTPEMYVEHTILIMREIRRVLRKDGVCFWNIGDSYGSGFSTSDNKYKAMSGNEPGIKLQTGVKPKDLCLIPARVALAAQADGWWVRSDIIWNKPNPMPESVKDRPTNAYEHILMLTRSSRYYWDIDAVREPLITEPHKPGWASDVSDRNDRQQDNESNMREWGTTLGRNLRDVWTFPTQPYPEAHFATFPQALPERCIKERQRARKEILSLTRLQVPAQPYGLLKNYAERQSDTNYQRNTAS